jgi:hypothetical protein
MQIDGRARRPPCRVSCDSPTRLGTTP